MVMVRVDEPTGNADAVDPVDPVDAADAAGPDHTAASTTMALTTASSDAEYRHRADLMHRFYRPGVRNP